MDSTTQLTAFDSLTQTRELQMLKTAIPYMKQSQKQQFAILIKYMELQNTIRLFSKNEASLFACDLPEDEPNSIAMLNELKKFCSPKELETLDMISNVLSMLDTCELIFN